MNIRLAQTKQVMDEVTGVPRLEKTSLVKRAKQAKLMDDGGKELESDPTAIGVGLTEVRSSSAVDSSSQRTKNGVIGLGVPGHELISLLEADITYDICGGRPMSGYNYLSHVSFLVLFFEVLESKLKELGNPLFGRAYYNNLPAVDKRCKLVQLAFKEEDQECLDTMAETMQELFGKKVFLDFLYWDIKESIEKESQNAVRRHRNRDLGKRLSRGVDVYVDPCAMQ